MADMVNAYALGMDSFALGLKKAAALIEDGRLDRFLEERYAGWTAGLGADIRNGKYSLSDLADLAEKQGKPAPLPSGGQEALQRIVNEILFG